MNLQISDVLKRFQLEGNVLSCEAYGEGHINQTKLIVTDSGKRYIFQKISEKAFPDVEGLMRNISGVTEFLRERSNDPRTYMNLVKTEEGQSYYRDENGAYRVYDFVEDTICLQQAENESDFFESAIGFGRFQANLRDFPAETLTETIKNFHNTVDRYRIFKETVKRDPLGRAKEVEREIEYALSKEEEMATLQTMREKAFLPLRVTHNDTKLNNVLLDKDTRKALCVIDLDTVMPGLSAYDFGDSIRFGAATAPEDETDLTRMEMNLHLYETFTSGFVGELKGLSKDEIMSFPLGAKTMTMECGVRFLTDYIDGDNYFGIKRKKHNLDRARTQFKLVSDMEKKWDEMRFIVEKYL